MTLRGAVLCALVSSTGLACVNASQPRSPRAALDHVVVSASANAAHAAEPVHHRPVDLAEMESLAVAGSNLARHRATVMVRAAAARVRAVILDFPNYPAFIPNYKSARVVATTPEGGMQVQMQIDALGGMIRRSMRVELSPLLVVGTHQSFQAKLLEGDVKAFETSWALDELADGTRLTLESFLDANLPFPATFIDSGSAAGVKESILAIKARAEEGGPP